MSYIFMYCSKFFMHAFREQQSPYDGIFYTSGWPKGYRKGDDCYQSLRVPDFKHVRFALMDLNLQRHPVYDNDYFQIKGCLTLFILFSILSS